MNLPTQVGLPILWRSWHSVYVFIFQLMQYDFRSKVGILPWEVFHMVELFVYIFSQLQSFKAKMKFCKCWKTMEEYVIVRVAGKAFI